MQDREDVGAAPSERAPQINADRSTPGGLSALWAGSAVFLVLIATIPVLGLVAIFFPPLLVVILAAFLVIGASGPYMIVRHGQRNKGAVVFSLALASVLALLCPEYNDSPATFAGGLLLIFPITFLAALWLKGAFLD